MKTFSCYCEVLFCFAFVSHSSEKELCLFNNSSSLAGCLSQANME